MRYLAAFLFGLAGIGLGAVNCWNNATAINGGTFVLNDLTAIVIGLAMASALIALAVGPVFGRSKVLGLLCIAAIAGATFVSVGYTLHRVGSMADAGAAVALAHNAMLERAKKRVAQLDAERKAEAANGGCGSECKKIIKRLEAAQAVLDGLGERQVVDPAGERLDAFTGGLLSARRYRVGHPVVTALTLELGVALLLAIAGVFGSPAVKPRPQVEIVDLKPINDPVLIALRKGPASNRELARRLGWSEAKTSRQVALRQRAGDLNATREGKHKMIALA